MTPADFQNALATIGWSGRQVAAKLDINEQTVRRWASGRQPIPENVWVWLKELRDTHARLHEPRGWFAHTNGGAPVFDDQGRRLKLGARQNA